MKRILKSIVIICLIMGMSSTVFADPVKVLVDNIRLDLPLEPVIVDGRTLVPLRAIFEALGASVRWDQATRTVTGIQGGRIIRLQIDKRTALVDGKKVSLDVAPTIKNGSTLVPVRFIAESLGAKVDWDINTRSVLINSDYPFGKYKVTRVIDGDTLEVDYKGKIERVRLIGVDSPESVHPDKAKNSQEGKLASDFTRTRLEGKEVALEFDLQERDQYGRLLAYIWYGGEMYNKALLEEGYAKVATYPPNVRYADEFLAVQNKARESKKGFWSDEK